MDGNWFTDILNMFFTFLDRIVYGLITFLYQLLLYLANLDLFGMSDLSNPDNVITNFSSRVYALLGIFMLFKISFSILQYMVNPDDFSDKGKGFGKMVTNVLISLCLIVAVPYIFSLAFEAQGTILKSNFLGQLILGNTTTSGESTSESLKDMNLNEEMAEDLQFLVYGSFFSVDSSVTDKCSSGPVLGTKSMAQNEGCLKYLAERFESVGGENKLGDFFAAGGADSTARRFDAFGEVVNIKTEDNKYLFKYMPVISTVAGGFVVVMLLSFCIDVAVRIIKLGFLEIIAPIPIISYMDPKQSGKDGMLGRWGSECFKTYLSLFIRLAIIYFAFFVVDLVANQILASSTDQIYLNEQAPTGLMAVFVQVMVILGVFMFAKEVPKLFERLIPGMQGAGDLHFDRIKTFGIGAAAGIGAGVGGFAANTIADVNWSGIRESASGVKNDIKGIAGARHMTLGNKAKQIVGTVAGAGVSAGGAMLRGIPRVGRTAVAGAGSAAIRGAYAGGTKKNFSTGVSRGIRGATDARNDRDVRQAAGYGVGKQISDAAYKFANKKNKAGGVGAMDQQVKEWTQRMNDAEGREHASRDQLSAWVGTNSTHNFREFQRAMFEPQLDNKGNVVMGENNTVIYDESKTRSYGEYLKTIQPGETPIDKAEFERFKSMQDDIIDANNTREYYRKQIKDYQDVMDMKDRREKK